MIFWTFIDRHVAKLLEKRAAEIRKIRYFGKKNSKELTAALVQKLQSKVDLLCDKDRQNINLLTQTLDSCSFALYFSIAGASDVVVNVSEVKSLMKFGAAIPDVKFLIGPHLRWPTRGF